MNWQKKGQNKPKPRQIMHCFFKLHNAPSLLVAVSSTPSIHSSWVLENSILDAKNAGLLFLWSLIQQESTVLILNVLLIMRFHVSENRHENFKPCGPSYRSFFQGPVSYCLRSIKKGAEKRNPPLPYYQIPYTGLILSPGRYIHQERITN